MLGSVAIGTAIAAVCALVAYLAKIAFLFWACRTYGIDKLPTAAEALRVIHTSPSAAEVLSRGKNRHHRNQAHPRRTS